MSLYRHVLSKTDLIEAVADRILEDLDVPAGQDTDWQGRVVGYFLRWRELAIAHPALADMLAARPHTTQRFYEHLETCITILKAAGFSDHDAVRTFYSLFAYVFGFVLWELPRAHDQSLEAYQADERDDIDDLPTREFPVLTELRDLLATNASPEQFNYGLERFMKCLSPQTDQKGAQQ
jgi:hypothetical protein